MTDDKIDSDWLPLLTSVATASAFVASAKVYTGTDNQGIPYAVLASASASTSIMIAAQYEEW